jgi:hypothetical protein
MLISAFNAYQLDDMACLMIIGCLDAPFDEFS